MRLKLIACEVLLRELCHAIARSPHQVDCEFLPKGLHDLGGAPMATRIQQQIDAVDPTRHDAIALGYALCGNGLHGIQARTLPLILPRAHDCIALLMGSRERYQEYFDANPGVYFRSTGWLERGQSLEQVNPLSQSLEFLIEKYGEDNGRYLYEEFHAYRRSYSRLTFLETGLEATPAFEEQARREAAEKSWEFSKLTGSLAWFEALLSGVWHPDLFLTVPPGAQIRASFTEDVVTLI